MCKQRPVLWSVTDREFIREMELFLLPLSWLLLVTIQLDYSGMIPFTFMLIITVSSWTACLRAPV